MNKSESIDQLAKALALAQAEMKNPPLDGENPHFRSRFCTLAGVREAVLPVFTRHGLSVIQSLGDGERGPSVTVLLTHTSGQWIETDPLVVPAVKQDPQAYGSAITYGRRFTLLALACVVGDDDDDGQRAAQAPEPARANGSRQAARPQKPAKKPDSPPVELPRDGAELVARLQKREAGLVADGTCAAGDLLTAVRLAGVQAGYVPDLVRWPAPAIQMAWGEAKKFIARCKAGEAPVHAS